MNPYSFDPERITPEMAQDGLPRHQLPFDVPDELCTAFTFDKHVRRNEGWVGNISNIFESKLCFLFFANLRHFWSSLAFQVTDYRYECFYKKFRVGTGQILLRIDGFTTRKIKVLESTSCM